MSETTPRPSRRRARLRRAGVLGAGAAAVLTVVALGATTLPPAGETVVFSPDIPQADTPEVAVATAEPEPTETAEETPSPMPEPDAESTAEPELAHEPSPTPTPSVEPESDSERAARSHRNGEPLWGRRFVGVSVTENGQPKELIPGTEIRVGFGYDTDTGPHQGGIGWDGGCNSRSSRLHVEPDRLILGEGSWGTLRGCPDAEAEQHAWLGRFFRSGPSWRIEGERLWLWSGGTIIEWHPAPPPPSEEDSLRNGRPLWGRSFVSVSVIEDGQPKQLVPGTELRVAFRNVTDGGSIEWSGGCNRSGASVFVEPERLLRGELTFSTSRGCSEEKVEQDWWLDRFLYSHPSWRVEGERLWLSSDGTMIELMEDHRPPENR